jgi:inorganic phosphate transporter, PiT family
MLLMEWALLLVASLFIAYANGANDNFKGVATLFGSGTTHYKQALYWASVTTFLGSICASLFAVKLIHTFSGRGLVPDSLVENTSFLTAVVLGAGITVFLAARFGIPISTTHSLTGALVGAGLIGVGEIGYTVLIEKFLIPLLASPLIAIGLTAFFYYCTRFLARAASINKKTCICVGEKVIPVGHLGVLPGGMLSTTELRLADIVIDDKEACKSKAVEMYLGKMFGIELQKILDGFHFLSAGCVSFARGLNDTPKMVAFIFAAGIFGLDCNVVLIASTILLGGLFGAKRVAHTVSQKITPMTHGQGLTANLVTAFLVIFASRFGVPVSTTHVSCGSLFGIGAVSGKANWHVISGILSAWLLTLPVAGLFSASFFLILNGSK